MLIKTILYYKITSRTIFKNFPKKTYHITLVVTITNMRPPRRERGYSKNEEEPQLLYISNFIPFFLHISNYVF